MNRSGIESALRQMVGHDDRRYRIGLKRRLDEVARGLVHGMREVPGKPAQAVVGPVGKIASDNADIRIGNDKRLLVIGIFEMQVGKQSDFHTSPNPWNFPTEPIGSRIELPRGTKPVPIPECRMISSGSFLDPWPESVGLHDNASVSIIRSGRKPLFHSVRTLR